jgi:hypothetical protein
MAPLYPFLLSGLFRLAPDTIEAAQWGQLVLGLGTTSMVYLAASTGARRSPRDSSTVSAPRSWSTKTSF